MDTITMRKIFTAVLALIGFSVMVFFIEEITEESEPNGTDIKSYISISATSNKPENGASGHTDDCWLREPFTVLSSCLPCTQFDVKAIKAKHCTPTGFYDRLNCTNSGTMAFKPCTSKAILNKSSFYTFFLANVILSIAFYAAASSRKATLDQYAYQRVGQHFDP